MIVLATRAGIGVASLAVLGLMIYVVWNWGLWNLSPIDKTYAKMSRLGRLGGFGLGRNQTPTEYALAIGTVLKDGGQSVQRIALAFATNQYSELPQESDAELEKELDAAWKNIRGGLLAQVFKRLTPSGIQRR